MPKEKVGEKSWYGELIFWFIIFINTISAFYGFFLFYGEQLSKTNPLLLILVPDCPLATALMTIALLLAYSKRRYSLFFFIAFVYALKYGFWTGFVLARYVNFYLPNNGFWIYSYLFLGHIGLFLEAFLLLGKINLRPSYIAYSLAFLVLNDFSDYILATAPALPPNTTGFIFPVTLLMSFFFTFFSYYVVEHYKEPIIRL